MGALSPRRRRVRHRILARGLLVLGAGLALGAAPARAQVARVEAVGSVPLGAASAGGATARQAALEAGIRDAVERTARELLAQAGAEAPPEAVRSALGSDLRSYALRYQILEDRGERAPLLEVSPGAQREYVVAVEVQVDQGQVRSQLTRAGLLAVAPAPAGRALLVAFEGVDSYPLWTRIRKVLGARGGGARPLEFARGRILVEVETDEDAAALAARLQRALGEQLEFAAIAGEGEASRIAVSRRVAPDEPGSPATPEGGSPAR